MQVTSNLKYITFESNLPTTAQDWVYVCSHVIILLSSTHCPRTLERASSTDNIFPSAYSASDIINSLQNQW